MTDNIYIFALICAALSILAILAVIAPMWRARAPAGPIDTDIDIYRDQLGEVERDLARGVLDDVEAERTRTEISRRLLNADATARAAASDAPRGLSRAAAVIVALGLIGAAGGLYWQVGAPGYGDIPRAERLENSAAWLQDRESQMDAEARNPETDGIATADPETAEILQSLRGVAFERPDDMQAFDYLARVEAGVGNYQRAARAQERKIALLGDAASEQDFVFLLDFLVLGTGGYVSPEAEALARQLQRDNPNSIPAVYYLGVLYAQAGRPDEAFDRWKRIIDNAEVDSLYWTLTSRQIEGVARNLGVDYALPSRRGPSDDDIAAAQDMAPEDREVMIEGMVAQLSDRLATEGGPPQDWARLISSLMVLGEEDTAREVLAEAELAFGGNVQAVQIIRQAATQAGLGE